MDADLRKKLELLALIDRTKLPNRFADHDEPATMHAMKDMVADGWIEGSAFPPGDPSIQWVYVICITAKGRKVMRDSMPVSRLRRFLGSKWTVAISITALAVAILSYGLGRKQLKLSRKQWERVSAQEAAPAPKSSTFVPLARAPLTESTTPPTEVVSPSPSPGNP